MDRPPLPDSYLSEVNYFCKQGEFTVRFFNTRPIWIESITPESSDFDREAFKRTIEDNYRVHI
jgi:hypothetical protein